MGYAHNQLSSEATTALEALIAQTMPAVFPALGITVMFRGEVLLEGAWGWVDPEERQYPVTVDTLFDLASVTKIFTTTAFLTQVSAGVVTLDTPLVEVIPEFGRVSPRTIDGGQDPHSKVALPIPENMVGKTVDPAQITFKHLLTHTSGLAPWRDVFNAAGPPPPLPDAVDPVARKERWQNAVAALCEYPFVGQPDGIVRYSDLGLMLLGEATSRLHSVPGRMDDAIADRVLAPLQLPDVLFNPVSNGTPKHHIVPTEIDSSWRQRRVWGQVHDENACGVGGVAGHAGLFAPARSVAKLGDAWLQNTAVFGVAPDLALSARTEYAETGLERRGLGWMLKSSENSSAGDSFSTESFGHTGFTGTSLWIDPQIELVVSCMTNRVYPGREKPGIHAFRRSLHDLLYKAAVL